MISAVFIFTLLCCQSDVSTSTSRGLPHEALGTTRFWNSVARHGIYTIGETNSTIPQLSNSWTATTIDPPNGVGFEQYHFVDDDFTNSSNPSGHWFRYPDQDCEYLEHYIRANIPESNTYYLGCYAVDCCKEAMDANIKDWQIAAGTLNIPVWYLGITTIESFNENITVQQWKTQYDVTPTEKATYIYSLTFANGNQSDPFNTILHRIDYRAGIISGAIEYKNFTPITREEQTAFAQKFQIPQQCTANNILNCDDTNDANL